MKGKIISEFVGLNSEMHFLADADNEENKKAKETNKNLVKSIRHKEYVDILTVCSCHVTYAFQSESTLYSCQNVKELLARSRREI